MRIENEKIHCTLPNTEFSTIDVEILHNPKQNFAMICEFKFTLTILYICDASQQLLHYCIFSNRERERKKKEIDRALEQNHAFIS